MAQPRAALIAMLLTATALVSPAAQADEKELRQRLEQQQKMIDQQTRTIEVLQKQMADLTAIMGTRVTKVEQTTENGKVVMQTSAPTPRLESPKGDQAIQIVGAIQATYTTYGQSGVGAGAPHLNNGSEIRRAQIGIQGTAFRDFGYALVIDAAATGGLASSVKDAYIRYDGFKPFSITIGNQKPQNGLEANFSDRSNAQIFIEPALSTDLLTPLGTRFLGVRASTGNDHYSASLGVFGDDINNNGTALPVQEGWGVHGRLTWAPIASKTEILHLGVSGAWRRVGTGRAVASDPVTSQIRYRARPESTVDGARLVDTGALSKADSTRTVGLELAGVFGPASLQAEHDWVRVTQFNDRTDLNFHGGYIAAAYALTGESRVYEGKNGVFTRFKPARNFDPRSGGWGAFEIAGRVSYIDLNSSENALASGGVRGGAETNYTLGMNWILNPYLRLMLDYTRADINKRSSADVDQSARVNIYSIRIHQEW